MVVYKYVNEFMLIHMHGFDCDKTDCRCDSASLQTALHSHAQDRSKFSM